MRPLILILDISKEETTLLIEMQIILLEHKRNIDENLILSHF